MLPTLEGSLALLATNPTCGPETLLRLAQD